MPTLTLYAPTPTIYIREPLLELGATNVLDLGCGSGGYGLDLAAHGAKVTGIDISNIALDLARFKLENSHKGIQLVHEGVVEMASKFDPDGEQFNTFLFGENAYIGDVTGPNWADMPEHEMYIGSKVDNVDFHNRDATSDLSDLVKGVDCVTVFNLLHATTSHELSHKALENAIKNVPVNGILGLSFADKYTEDAKQANYKDGRLSVWEDGTTPFSLVKCLEHLGFEFQKGHSLDLRKKFNIYLDVFDNIRDVPADESMIYSDEEVSRACYMGARENNPSRGFVIQCYFGKRLENSSLSLKEAIERSL